MKVNRKQFFERLGWAAGGALAGVAAARTTLLDRVPLLGRPRYKQPEPPPSPSDRVETYSQAGEDVDLDFTFRAFFGGSPTSYLDVGAHHPTKINNTYFFYLKGARGVLVEPNGVLCDALREHRPNDVTLEAGIGFGPGETLADYHYLTESSLNTFSREQAERIVAESNGRYRIEAIRQVPLLNINDVIAKHFKGAPAFVSIDVEGLDLEILKSFDFAKYRPKAFCVETLITNTRKQRPEIAEFMASQKYVARGGSFVNTIFYDEAALL